MALGDIIARLAVHLDLDSASFETGAKKAATTTDKMHAKMSKAAKGIGVALAGMVTLEGINQLRDMHRAALDSAGGLGEQAKALGVSTTALQEFRFAATQTGLSTEQMDNALGQFSKRLGEAMVTGKGKFIQGLEQIGLSLEDLKGKTESEQIALIADGINKLGTEAEKSAAQVAFFGKSGQAMATLLGEGSKGIKAFADEAERAGIILSEGDIAKADETADKLAQLDYVLQARLNKTMLQHSESVTQAEVAWGEFKIKAVAAIGEVVVSFGNMIKYVEGNKLQAAIQFAAAAFQPLGTAAVKMGEVVGTAIRNMVSSVYSWIVGKLGAAWNRAKADVERITLAFKTMYKAVVGNSYVPDMVEGVAAEMARLDGVMVTPAEKATKKVTDAFRKMSEESRGLLERLFPEVGEGQKFRKEMELISRFPSSIQEEARRRLAMEGRGEGSTLGDLVAQSDNEMRNFNERMADSTQFFLDQLAGMKEGAKATTVRVAESFADMAENISSSLTNLGNAIKGGGFLDIFNSVIGVVTSLGKAGLFGKSFSTFLKSTPGYAGGTMSASRGLAMVGERGPELVAFRGGERVFNNRDSRRMMGGGVMEIRPSPLFEVYVDGKLVEAAPMMISAAANAGAAKMQRMEGRRLA
jgi:hypothetical protein